MKKHANVTGRIEQVRLDLGLNKSRFSSEIGMKPQTYNNFTGKQASKPNLELVVGIVSRFGVNPSWLLLGEGQPYVGEGPRREHQNPGNGNGRQGDLVSPMKVVGSLQVSSISDNGHASGQLELRKQLVQLQFDLAALVGWCAKTSEGIENVLEKLDTGNAEAQEKGSHQEG